MAHAMYVRVKRQKTTVFLHVDPTDQVKGLKAKLGELLGKDPSDLGLLRGSSTLTDEASLAESKIESDDVLSLVYRLEGGGWEPVDITIPSETAEES